MYLFLNLKRGSAPSGLHNTDLRFSGSGRIYAPVFLPQQEYTAAGGRAFYDRTVARLLASLL